MEGHPNIEVFKRAYEAFTSGDMDALANVFAEDVVWHTPGCNPISGDHRGRAAAFASFEKEFELSGGTYHPVVHDILANDEHTVALLHVTAEREGRKLDQNYALVFHIRNGRIKEAWEALTDEAAWDVFWL
jgi:ketosteroid isomerase-like protein